MSNRSRPVVNRHKAPAKMWAKWSNDARRVFNRMYQRLAPHNQWIYQHPSATIMPKAHWQTVRFNVAWEAAEAVDRAPIPNKYIAVYGGK